MKATLLNFRRDESVRAGLVRIADGLIESAVARIERPSDNRHEDLHEVRVTIKCLRAILRLLQPVASPALFKRENARLRDAAKRLAPLRDIAMARRTLEKLLDKLPDGKDRDAFRTVARAFDQETLAAPQTERQRESALRRAAAALRKTDRSLRVAPLLARGWEVIGPGLERLYRQNCASMARARITGKDGDFHQWRKRAKFLWYQVRMLTPIWPKHLAKLAERLNDLQDQLGADHDLAVLKGFLLRRPDRFGGEPTVRRITTCLDKLMVKLRENSQALGNKIFVHRPRRFVNELGERWGEWQTRRKASPRDNPPSASARSR